MFVGVPAFDLFVFGVEDEVPPAARGSFAGREFVEGAFDVLLVLRAFSLLCS